MIAPGATANVALSDYQLTDMRPSERAPAAGMSQTRWSVSVGATLANALTVMFPPAPMFAVPEVTRLPAALT